MARTETMAPWQNRATEARRKVAAVVAERHNGSSMARCGTSRCYNGAVVSQGVMCVNVGGGSVKRQVTKRWRNRSVRMAAGSNRTGRNWERGNRAERRTGQIVSGRCAGIGASIPTAAAREVRCECCGGRQSSTGRGSRQAGRSSV